nr:type II CRISPR RNA-guided endonuclease Cas9 [uncultured Niameybacter sp.]
MGENFEKYSIGLDVGTNSVGWCVVDSENNLLKRGKKNMWGVRLFEAGQTAEVTRKKRGHRRRYMRRKERIRLLQELLGETILQKDESFFIRLEDSFLWKEDKRLQNEYTLFNDSNYSDSDYYKQYPTIYHLRKYLVNTKEQVDIRLIYLALHHIIKYRGHFIYEGQDFTISNSSYTKKLSEIVEEIGKWTELSAEESVLEEISHILEDKRLRRKDKQEKIKQGFIEAGLEKKMVTELSKAMLGYKVDLSALFQDKELVDEGGKGIGIEFSNAAYEEQVDSLQNVLQERYQGVELLQELYSQYTLNDILNGQQYISEAMVAKYNKHHEDLQILKRLVKTYAKDKYYDFFRSDKDKLKNYVHYIKGDKACNQEELYKAIKAILKNVPHDDADYTYCIREIAEYKFLVRLNNRENGSIPYQINKMELEQILQNQEQYYPQIKQNKDKIESILTFRIPYYVGPLTPPHMKSRFAWVERRGNGKIYPWNFDEIVDKDVSAEKFITKMTNYCTYLPEEKVIPKASLLYSKFMVLNELKGIRINEKRLTVEDEKKIMDNLFLHTKKVTHNKFCEWLQKQQYPGGPEYTVTGYQKENEFASSLGLYLDFYKIFNKIDRTNESMIEEMIYWLTVFQEKSIIEKKIKQKYGEAVNDYQLKQILRLKPQGWSRISRKLLTQLMVKDNEENHNIMYYLENTSMNFMQIISHKKLGFNKKIEENQFTLKGKKIELEDIAKLQGSPAIKKAVWQTTKLIEEIRKIMGHDPENIFIEFARSDEQSKRSKSRKNKLEEAYNKLQEDVEEYNEKVVKELKDKKYVDKLNDEQVYLYFIQNGKCMYSGEQLDINQLSKYQIDHIIPQCYIKDDSFENKVLVKSIENQRKLDSLLLNQDIQQKNQVWWEKLYKHGLIGPKKYYNLTRRGFSEQEQKGFINRQLVETRQICKHVAVLLQDSFVNTRIVITKAELSHNFRMKYGLYKSRSINDYHHAQDAYLASVIGNTLLMNKDTDSAEWIYNQYVTKYKKKGQNRNNNYGYVIGLFDKEIINEEGLVVWDGSNSLEKVIKLFNYKDCCVTKKLEENTDKFYDETIYPHDSGKTLIPLKEHLDVAKYGGYSGVKNAYSVVVEVKHKKKREKKLVGIPVQIAYSIKQGKRNLMDYLTEIGYEDIVILRDKVLKYQLIEEKGELEFITSAQEVCNAKQLLLDREMQSIIYQIENPKARSKEKFEEKVDETYKKILNKIKIQYPMFSTALDKMQQVLKYDKLELEQKCILILELLKLTKADAQNANLKKIHDKLGDRVGRKNNYTIDIQNTLFIDQSITGLYERRCRL